MSKDFKKENIFGLGSFNKTYAPYFKGKSYLNPVVTQGLGIYNVTFEPACRNNWHIHHATSGGGQILLCIAGEGWYQRSGQPATNLKPGDRVYIPSEVKHWHGAKKDSWFAHLSIEVPGENTATEWCEPVTEEEYDSLN